MSSSLLSVSEPLPIFLGDDTIYTWEAWRALLGLTEYVFTMRALTENYALMVAEAVRKKPGATWGLSESGASGPAGNSCDDAIGRVAVALSGPKTLSLAVETGSYNRVGKMWLFADDAMNLLQEGLAAS